MTVYYVHSLISTLQTLATDFLGRQKNLSLVCYNNSHTFFSSNFTQRSLAGGYYSYTFGTKFTGQIIHMTTSMRFKCVSIFCVSINIYICSLLFAIIKYSSRLAMHECECFDVGCDIFLLSPV